MADEPMKNDLNDEQIRLLLSACADKAMSSLHEEEMDGYDHHFSDKFDKKVKKMLWSERYFGRKIHAGYIVRRAAVILIIAASLATAGTVSAKVFDFRPWEYLPLYDWIAGEDEPEIETTSERSGESGNAEKPQTKPAATPKPTPVPFSVEVGTEARYALSGDGQAEYFPLKVLGYKNSYQITMESAPDMEKFYIEGNSIVVSPDAEPGEYTLGYRVTDGEGCEIFQDITIVVEKAVRVTGRILKSDGTEIRDSYLEFKLTDDDKSYQNHYYFAEVDPTQGSYSVYLPPNRSYVAYISGGNTEKRFVLETGTDEMSHDFDIDAWGLDEDVPPDELRTPLPDEDDEEGHTADPEDPYDPGAQKNEDGHERPPEEDENSIREDESIVAPVPDPDR